MSGNNDKAAIWGDADVLIAPVGSLLPATLEDPFNADWRLVGLLDGEDGFGESRNVDTADHTAWGGRLVRTSRRNFVLSRTFTALEENAVTAGLVYPGSTAEAIKIPERFVFMVAFVTYDGPGRTKRLVTPKYAEVDEVSDITENESDLRKFEITVKIYPDNDGVLFVRQASDQLNWVPLPLTPAITSAAGVANISSLPPADEPAAVTV